MTKQAALAALAVIAVTAAAAPDPFATKLRGEERIRHAISRLTFGARPGDVEHVKKLGVNKWIEAQLHPERLAQNPILEQKLAPLETLALSVPDVTKKYPLRAPKKNDQAQPDPAAFAKLLTRDQMITFRRGTIEERFDLLRSLDEEKQQAIIETLPPRNRRMVIAAVSPELRRTILMREQPAGVVVAELLDEKVYRALYSSRQLEEVLTDFWFNHFNVYMNKGPVRLWTTAYERDAIRPHVLGKFHDMLLATARHPAMLWYLDNWQSADPGAASRLGRMARSSRLLRQIKGLNENYAREIMELHTLGVDGGYTQQDVIEVARCFTGWTLRDARNGGGYQFAPLLHDRGEKIVLGHKIAAGGGESDGLRVIDILARHPSTARFISTKLARRFVADDPPAALVERMAATFRKTGGDLREVMRTMLDSREFWSEGAYRAKMKSPFEMVISAARALDAQVSAGVMLAGSVEQLGQALYRKEEPTGYYDTAEEWVNTAGLLGRMNFATELASGRIPGTKVNTAALLEAAAYRGVSNDAATPELRAGLILGSPEFQRR